MPATTLHDRALLRLSGEDVRGFLQGLVTNDLDRLAPDRPLWAGLLTPQDAGSWKPHVTIQNKVEPQVAKLLLQELSRDFVARDVEIAGLGAWWYRGGPWEPFARCMFG